MGLLLALATSGGIAGERITRGAFDVALVANAVTTVVAVAAVVLMMRRGRSSVAGLPAAENRSGPSRVLAVLGPQVLGAASGIVLVHAVLHREALATLPWLSERPAQFVNDAVAVSGVLALVWASAAGLDTRLLVLAFLGVSAYRVTSSFWHLDHAPGGFHTSVQELVVAQFVAAALALGLFRTALNRKSR
ncbi:MAG: hypothetical protein ACLQVI_18935 [Polyangiaceae bacterium]